MASNSTLSNTNKSQAARQQWGPSFEAPVALARRSVALGDAKALRRNLEASLGGNGYDVSAAVDGLSGWRFSLLHLAAFEGSVDTTLLLLSAGASVDAQDLDGWTPLHYAARNEMGGEVVVRALVAAGAKVDKANHRGRTALHIAYLSRNYDTASELLEHGASTALRDNFGKTAQQMLELSKPVRRRPWSGSSAIPGGSRELSACRRGLPCTSRPRTATGVSGGSARAREAASASSRDKKSVVAAETAASDKHLHHDQGQIDVGDSLSTLPLRGSVANAKEGSVSALTVVAGAGRNGGAISGHGTSPTECWRCRREMAILDADDHHHQLVAGSCTGEASTAPNDTRGGLDHSSYYSSSGADNEAASPCGDTAGGRGVAYASRTGVAPRQDQHRRSPSPGASETLLAEASAFGTLTTDGSPTSVGGGGGGGGDTSNATRGRADVTGRPVPQAALLEEEEEEDQLLELSFLHVRRHNNAGEGEENATENLATARERSSRSGGGGRRHAGGGGGRISGRSPNQRSRRQAGKRGGRRRGKAGVAGGRARRNGRARGAEGAGGGASDTGQQRRFFCPGDEVPEYVVGRRRMLWAQRSAEHYARRVSDLKRRREEIASPRRQKMAAAADREKRRAERELERKERVRNSPLRWDRDGRPCSSPAALPAAQSSSTEPSSPLSLARDHQQQRPSTAGPYGGRSCLKCDPRQWYRGEFMGGLAGLGAGSPPRPRRGGQQEDEGEGGRLWNRAVSDRYRLLRPWTTSPHDESELWWAKPRLSGSGTAVVVKVLADGKRDATGWEAFIREWGVLKYLQEEGRVGGREPLSVGLVCAFETERSLVLSIPAGSRTLREVGQQMHSERRNKKSRNFDGIVFDDQVESLATQACRAVRWLHHHGLISGDVTPDNFVLLGGGGGGGGGSSSTSGGRHSDKDHSPVRSPARGHGGGGGDCSGGGGESELRVVAGRSAARRSDAAGGCPRHPLLEPVTHNFPLCQSFDKAHASPERIQAALDDVPCPAEIADDAWGLGTTIYWLLTGREDYVPGARVHSTWGVDEANSNCESPAPAHVSAPSSVRPGRGRRGVAEQGNRDESPREDGVPACAGTVCSALPDLLSLDPRRRETALALAARHAELVHTRTFGSPSSPGGNPPFLTAVNSPKKGTGSPPRLRKGRQAASAAASETVAFPRPLLPSTAAASKRDDGREVEPATATAEEAEATAVVAGSDKSRDGHDREPPGGLEGMVGGRDGKEAAVMATASNGDTAEDGAERSPSRKSVDVGGRSPTAKRTPRTQEPKIGADVKKSVAVGTTPATSPRATFKMAGTSTSSPRPRSPKSKGTQLGSQAPTGSGPGIVGQRAPDPAASHSSPSRDARDGGSGGSNNDTEVPGGGDIFEDGREGPAGRPAKDDLEATLSVFPLGEAGRAEGGGGKNDLGATHVDFPAGRSRSDEPGGQGTGDGGEGALRRSEDAEGSASQDAAVVAPNRQRVAGGGGSGDAGPHDGSGDLQSRQNNKKKKNRVAPIDLINTKTRPPAEEASIVTGREGASTATAGNGNDGGRNSAKNVRRSSSGSALLGSRNAVVVAQKKRLSADAGVQCSRPAESSDRLTGQVAGGGCGCAVM